MTGKTFRHYVYLTIGALLLASFVTLWAGVWCAHIADASRAAIPVYIAVAAAWLTFCLQRRIAYTNALRSLWEAVVATVQDALHYTGQAPRTADSYGRVVRDLCCRVDEVRGVFRNVGERYRAPTVEAKVFVRSVKHAPTSERLAHLVTGYVDEIPNGGVYPFESLKQIHGVLERLGHGRTASAARAKVAHDTILILWRILRAELLKELDRDFPEFPDTPYEPRPFTPVVKLEVQRASAVKSHG